MNKTFNYEIAIPSFNRKHIIKERSIKLLESYNFPKEKVKIFLRDEEQLEMYKETIGDDYTYILTGCSGIMETRNFLRYYYHEDCPDDLEGVLFLDDDIEEFNELVDNKLVPVKDLDQVVQQMFLKTKELGFRLWAPSAYNNSFYMKDKISTNLKYCIGAFQGLIIDKSRPVILTPIGHFEDFVFTLEHFLADLGVVRFEKYSIKTKYFEPTGGICGSLGGLKNRQKEMAENAQYMILTYGEMVSLKMKSWGHDLRLNFRYKSS